MLRVGLEPFGKWTAEGAEQRQSAEYFATRGQALLARDMTVSYRSAWQFLIAMKQGGTADET